MEAKNYSKAKGKAYVKTEKEILDRAFKAATAEIRRKRFIKDNESFIKTDSSQRIEKFSETLRADLVSIEKVFPDLTKLSDFQQETLKSCYDIGAIRKSIASLKGSAIAIRKMERAYKGRIYNCRDPKRVGFIKKEFFGRAASFVKRDKGKLNLLKEVSKFIERMPPIKEEFTSIIAGFPNVGKSTMLSRLTGSTPEISNYPFTTKAIMMGYMKIGYEEFQFIDTPGILDKKPEDRNEIEKRAVAALTHLANLIIYVADPSEGCGYSLKEQEKLLEVVKAEFRGRGIVVVINKADACSKEQMGEARKFFPSGIIIGKGMETEAKKRIIEEIIKANKEKAKEEIPISANL